MAHVERTRAVVESGETYDGRIVPAEQAEIDRPVRIRDDSTVLGSVYGETVEGATGATVEGSIMASESVDLEGSHVHGEVGTPGSVVAADSHVDGTVTGQRVRLTDCVVRGNVVGADVVLENCVVLGLATADRSLTIEDSLCYTFRSRGETTLEETTVVLPQAITDGPLTLETPVAVAGLGRLDVEDSSDEDSMGEDSTGEGSLPEMDASDRYEQDETTYLTLAPRVLNLEAVTERLEELEDGIMAAVDDTSDEGGADLSVDEVLDVLDVSYDAPTSRN
jgi:hypothetical protein